MSKRMLILMCSIFLIVPLLFMGCGVMGLTARTARPARPARTGANRHQRPPRNRHRGSRNLRCVPRRGKDRRRRHAAQPQPDDRRCVDGRDRNAAITAVTFGTPVGDNVPVSMIFTFQAISDTGRIHGHPLNLLDNSSATQLRFARFSLAKLVPGTSFPASGTQGTNEWFDYVNGSRVNGNLVRNNLGFPGQLHLHLPGQRRDGQRGRDSRRPLSRITLPPGRRSRFPGCRWPPLRPTRP